MFDDMGSVMTLADFGPTRAAAISVTLTERPCWGEELSLSVFLRMLGESQKIAVHNAGLDRRFVGGGR
jgi:hypothetical protein